METTDKLLSFHEKLSNFFHKYIQLILTVIIIFIALILMMAGYNYYKNKKEKEAYIKLLQALNQSHVVTSLENFVNKYENTQAGFQALLILWNIYYQQSEYSKMQNILNKLKNKYPHREKILLSYSKAKLAENQKKFDLALKEYKKILNKLTLLDPFIYYDLARIYEIKKEKEKALEYYKKLLKTYPDFLNRAFIEYKVWALQS